VGLTFLNHAAGIIYARVAATNFEEMRGRPATTDAYVKYFLPGEISLQPLKDNFFGRL
jgi:hypothetical protein